MCLKHEGVALYDSGKSKQDCHIQVCSSIFIDPTLVRREYLDENKILKQEKENEGWSKILYNT